MQLRPNTCKKVWRGALQQGRQIAGLNNRPDNTRPIHACQIVTLPHQVMNELISDVRERNCRTEREQSVMAGICTRPPGHLGFPGSLTDVLDRSESAQIHTGDIVMVAARCAWDFLKEPSRSSRLSESSPTIRRRSGAELFVV